MRSWTTSVPRTNEAVTRTTDILDKPEPEVPPETVGEQESNASDEVDGKRVALVGRFGGMNQRQAANVLRSYKAIVVDQDADAIDWVVIGADESPIAEPDLLIQRVRDAAAAGETEIMHETELWQRLGLVDVEQSVRRFHTPAMFAVGIVAA